MGEKDNNMELFLFDDNGEPHKVSEIKDFRTSDGGNNCEESNDLSIKFKCSVSSTSFSGVLIGSTAVLKRYGIYITNNGLKMHGQPKKRKSTRRKQKYVTGLLRHRH